MPKIPSIVPVTDLRQDAAAVLKRLKSSSEPLVITQRGRAAAILLSWMRTRDQSTKESCSGCSPAENRRFRRQGVIPGGRAEGSGFPVGG